MEQKEIDAIYSKTLDEIEQIYKTDKRIELRMAAKVGEEWVETAIFDTILKNARALGGEPEESLRTCLASRLVRLRGECKLIITPDGNSQYSMLFMFVGPNNTFGGNGGIICFNPPDGEIPFSVELVDKTGTHWAINT
jgi:hypothetical protein